MGTFNNILYDLNKRASDNSGYALTDSGVAGLRDLDKRYNEMLANGGLTPDLSRQFDVAKGALSDQYVRSGRSLRAALAARRQQTGGALTPGAIAEMEKEASVNRDENYNTASNDLAMQKANLSFSATKDWYSRLESIRDSIRQTGLTREQQATLARLQVASLKLQKKQTTLGALTSVFKGLSFGGG